MPDDNAAPNRWQALADAMEANRAEHSRAPGDVWQTWPFDERLAFYRALARESSNAV